MIAAIHNRYDTLTETEKRIAHMCILDALMMSLAARDYSALQQHLSERNEILKQMRYKNK